QDIWGCRKSFLKRPIVFKQFTCEEKEKAISIYLARKICVLIMEAQLSSRISQLLRLSTSMCKRCKEDTLSRMLYTETCTNTDLEFNVKSYNEIPGPKPIPILGNTWRMLPLIGKYEISDTAKISRLFYEEYGKIVRLSGLIGRPDLLFVYDADEIEKIYRQEGPTPFRPSMPCLVHYKSVIRKDFFEDIGGVVGVHGAPWKKFRTRVQKPVLQPQIVKKYITPIETVTSDFIKRYSARRWRITGRLR
ncbi:hypothetical protein V1478_013645, partial [Vespula squamosa]